MSLQDSERSKQRFERYVAGLVSAIGYADRAASAAERPDAALLTSLKVLPRAPGGACRRGNQPWLIGRHLRASNRRISLGADKAYDVTAFIGQLRERQVTPHITIDGHLSKTSKPHKTAIDGRTLRHVGYAISRRCRKRIEEIFG